MSISGNPDTEKTAFSPFSCFNGALRQSCACILFALLLPLLVPVDAAAQPRTPPDFTPPPLPAELDQHSHFAEGLNPDDEIDTLVMVDESIEQVLQALENLTGKIVLQQESLPTPLLNFNSRGKLNRSEAVLAIETILSLNGVSITSMGDKFLKAIPTASIRYQAPDIITGSTLSQPTSQRHYAKVFPIKHLSMEDVTQIVNTLQTPGLSSQLVLKKANAIMVTDSLTNLQQIERVLNRVDVPVKMDTKMIFRSLNYISAIELKNRLDNMARGPLKRFLEGEIHFEADERTNQIVILSDPANVPVIDQVISSLDVDAAPLTRTEVFYLKHASAEEIASLLNSLVKGQSSNNREDNRVNSASNRGAIPEQSASDAPIVPINQSVNADQVASDQFSPFITIESDERSNSIIAFGTASDIRYIADLIDKIDVLLAQVKIDVIIAEVNIGDKYSRGIDSFGVNLDNTDEITIGVNQVPSTSAEGGFANPITDLPIRVGATLENFTMSAVFQTAQTDSDVSILSAPTLVTTHNKEATISAGEKRPIITASSTDTTGSSIRSSVDLKDIGIKLKFKPLIGSNGVVQLEIEQTIDTVNGTTKIDGNEQPIIGSRSATSYVSVADGDVIVLGGLQEVSHRKTKGKMFLLGQIPLLGDWLFSSKRDEDKVQDLVIFIRPQVIYETEDVKTMSDRIIDSHPQREDILDYLEDDHMGDRQGE